MQQAAAAEKEAGDKLEKKEANKRKAQDKAEAADDEMKLHDWKDMMLKGQLGKLTMQVLRQYLLANGLTAAGTKKEAVVAQVGTHIRQYMP